MASGLLALTILFEGAGTTLMKLSNGLTQLWPSVAVSACHGAAVAGLTLALRSIALSIADAVWSGAGTALRAVIGIAWFRAPATALKIVSRVLVTAGVIGLGLAAGSK